MHSKILFPIPKLVTEEVGEFTETIVADPAMIDQVPIPVAGVLAANTEEEEQIA